MKLTKYLALATIASVFAFTACKDDDPIVTPADPTVAITEGETLTIPSNSSTPYSVTLNIDIDAPGKIKEFKFVRNTYLGETIVHTFEEIITTNNGQTSVTNFVKTDEIILGHFHLGTIDRVVYQIIVTDENDNLGEATCTVTMGAYTALTTEKSGQIWKIHGTGNGSWNLKDDETVSSTLTDEATIAKRYIINSDNVNTVNDPANFSGSWTSGSVEWTSTGNTNYTTAGNGTLYVKANNYNYTSAPKEVALYMFSIGTQSTAVNNPAVNDIYIGKKGDELYVIKITEYDQAAVYSPAKLNTGVLRFTYKK